MSSNYSYLKAASLDQAVEHLEDDGARVHSGGTDLLGCIRDGVFTADKLVSLSGLSELKGIEELPDGGVRIGAMTSVADLARNELVKERYAGLHQTANVIASPQLREQGTVGGNLCQRPRCWYFRGDFHCLRKHGDTCYAMGGENQYHAIFGAHYCCVVSASDRATTMLALDATFRIQGPNGRRDVSVEDFYVLPEVEVTVETILKPGEILTEIVLPAPESGTRTGYRKIRTRQSWDFAIVGVALNLQMRGARVSEARVAFSGVAPVPWRSRETEDALRGATLNTATIRRAAEAGVANAQPLAKNGYKLPLLKGTIEEALEGIADPG